MNYDVAIVGGGASGLACALTLVSSKGRGWEWAEGRRYVLFDTSGSDLRKALLNNVPGVPRGTTGAELLKRIKSQIESFGGVDFVKDRVVSVQRVEEVFELRTAGGKEFTAGNVVLSTGFHGFDIEGLNLEIVENPKSPKPGRVMVKHNGDYKVDEGLWVAGLLAGASSMFTAAAGIGVQVAINILSEWAGKPVVIHDVPGQG